MDCSGDSLNKAVPVVNVIKKIVETMASLTDEMPQHNTVVA